MTIELLHELRKQLRKCARQRRLSATARDSGVALSTLRRIIDGKNCALPVADKLQKHFAKQGDD